MKELGDSDKIKFGDIKCNKFFTFFVRHTCMHTPGKKRFSDTSHVKEYTKKSYVRVPPVEIMYIMDKSYKKSVLLLLQLIY